MISKEEQLKNKANWETKEGIYLKRCMNCSDAGKKGRENWAQAVASGYCAWCGWRDKKDE